MSAKQTPVVLKPLVDIEYENLIRIAKAIDCQYKAEGELIHLLFYFHNLVSDFEKKRDKVREELMSELKKPLKL